MNFFQTATCSKLQNCQTFQQLSRLLPLSTKLQKFKIVKNFNNSKFENIKSSKNFKTSKTVKNSLSKKKTEVYKHILGRKHALFKVLKFSRFAPQIRDMQNFNTSKLLTPRRWQTCSTNHPLLPSGRDQLQKSPATPPSSCNESPLERVLLSGRSFRLSGGVKFDFVRELLVSGNHLRKKINIYICVKYIDELKEK